MDVHHRRHRPALWRWRHDVQGSGYLVGSARLHTLDILGDQQAGCGDMSFGGKV